MSNDSQPKENRRVVKSFGLSTLSVNNRKTVFLITFLIFVAGISSYISMPKENFPELVIPQIYVGTIHPGNSPEVIEEKITAPLEKEINSITGVDKIKSTSIQGYSTIFVEFDFEVTPSAALQKVKDAVDKARGDKNFPVLSQEPNVFEMNFAEFPIMNINLSGDYSVDQLKKYAELLEDEIETLTEISKVEIRGVQEKEMRIKADRAKMEARRVSFGNIQNAVSSENVSMSAGEMLVDGKQYSIQFDGQFKNAEEIGAIIVKREKQEIIRLRDVAEVVFEDADPTSFAREFGKPVVMLDVIKTSGANLLEASDKIEEILYKAQKTEKIIPENLVYTITNDQSDITEEQVSNLENSIIFGVILVVLVLLFFLGLRNALFVGVAIPLSMFMAFMILDAMGVTLNVMVLFSLILALGMLVDNGIVVVENIYRLMDEGLDAFAAAKQGVGEVALPIIASTATTLAAFLPLAIWPGMMGEFMQYLPITLMIVLGSSLFVALVINPVLTAVYMKVENKMMNRKKVFIYSGAAALLGVTFVAMGAFGFGNFLILIAVLLLLNMLVLLPGTRYFQSRILPRLESRYRKLLTYAVGKRPGLMILGTVALLVFSFVLIITLTPKVEFFPVNQPNYVNVFIQHPIGTDIRKTNETTRKVEAMVKTYLDEHYGHVYAVKPVLDAKTRMQKYDVKKEWSIRQEGDSSRLVATEDSIPLNDTIAFIQSIISSVGEGTSDPAEGPSMGSTPHKARVTISFAEFKYRYDPVNEVIIRTSDVQKEIDSLLNKQFPEDILLTVVKNSNGPPMDPPINIEVKAPADVAYGEVVYEANKIREYLKRGHVKGIDELKLDVENGKPEYRIKVNREVANRLDVSTSTIAQTIRTSLFGAEFSTFKEGDEDYDITLLFNEKDRYSLDDQLNQRITFRDPTNGQVNQIPLRTLIMEPEVTYTYSAVKRKDLDQLVTIFSGVATDYNANEVVAEMKERLAAYPVLREGWNVKFTGQQEEQAKEMAFLGRALMIAVFLIFLIIISQFNSFSIPVVVLTAVFLSLIGVLLGLVIFQMDFIIIMTMIGIISLAGVVVNNAIVLIDYTNLIMLRKKNGLGLKKEDYLPIKEVLASVVEGGQTRLRPVLLTAITTVLGLFPLATGFNFNFVSFMTHYDPQFFIGGDMVMFFGPMSWTIIFGLTFATFLTLVIVPVMYYLLTRLKYRIYKINFETGKVPVK